MSVTWWKCSSLMVCSSPEEGMVASLAVKPAKHNVASSTRVFSPSQLEAEGGSSPEDRTCVTGRVRVWDARLCHSHSTVNWRAGGSQSGSETDPTTTELTSHLRDGHSRGRVVKTKRVFLITCLPLRFEAETTR